MTQREAKTKKIKIMLRKLKILLRLYLDRCEMCWGRLRKNTKQLYYWIDVYDWLTHWRFDKPRTAYICSMCKLKTK